MFFLQSSYRFWEFQQSLLGSILCNRWVFWVRVGWQGCWRMVQFDWFSRRLESFWGQYTIWCISWWLILFFWVCPWVLVNVFRITRPDWAWMIVREWVVLLAKRCHFPFDLIFASKFWVGFSMGFTLLFYFVMSLTLQKIVSNIKSNFIHQES
mgnify:CR=1 FL=1